MKKVLLSVAVLFWLAPIFVFAHGDNYLEFNPDKSFSLKEADVATPSQAFFAQNDFLGGFDFWVASPAAAGTTTFNLLNEQNIVITSKTVTIPTIPLTSSGTKLHVDFNSQLPVLADDKYTLQVTTSMPELRLYYSDRVQVVSHNAPFVSEYIIGVAKLGAEEQLFSFKYALYETNETSAPIISNISWTVVSANQMKIEFNTNEAVDYMIEYGPASPPAGGYTQSTNYLGDYQFCTEGITTCDIIINVLPSSTYQYRLTVKDIWGNQSQFIGIFTSGQSQTPAPTPIPTDAPPAISNLRITEVGQNSVGVAWTTNEIANSDLIIKFAGFITVTSKFDPTFELEHFIETDPNLNPGTLYTAFVTSRDLANNKSEASLSFTTLSNQPSPSPSSSPSPTLPLPSSSSPPPQNSVTPAPSLPNQPQGVTTSPVNDGAANIGWGSPQNGEPSDGYRVDIFDKNGNLKRSIFVSDGSHSVNVSGLEEGDSVIVYENNGGVFKKIDKPKQFNPEESFIGRLLSFWPYLMIAVILAVILAWRVFKRKVAKITLPVKI